MRVNPQTKIDNCLLKIATQLNIINQTVNKLVGTPTNKTTTKTSNIKTATAKSAKRGKRKKTN